MTLDKTLGERAMLNRNIVASMNAASSDWGIKCLRYEIRDIHPPENVVASMHQQVSADRKKRAEILESEGQRQSAINVAEGNKQSAILESEGVKAKQVNHAQGEADAVRLKAQATAQMIEHISESIRKQGAEGKEAISMAIAEKYIEAYSKLAKESTTVVVPANVGDAAGMVTQMMTVFDSIKKR